MKNIHAVELGKARWKNLSQDERSAVARLGGLKKWSGKSKEERTAIALKSWENRRKNGNGNILDKSKKSLKTP